MNVHVSYSQYLLQSQDAELTDAPYAGGNGLIWVDPAGNSAVVMTGTDTGGISLTIDILNSPPAATVDGWDDIVEVSTQFTGDGIAVYGPTDTEGGHEITLPAGPDQPRWYRLRIHARGRQQGRQVQFVDTAAGEPSSKST